MPLSYKQVAAYAITAADTNETAYTVPADTEFVGQIVVANTSSTLNRTFRLAVIAGGGAVASEDYLAYDVTITPGETWTVTGITLEATDEVMIRSDATSTTAGTGIIVQLYGELQT